MSDTGVRIDLVAEIISIDETAPWPISAATGWLAIGDNLTREDVGLFIAQWAHGLVDLTRSGPEVLDALIHADDWSVFGGLRVVDPQSDVAVLPGCCSRIDDWRTWVTAPDGGLPDVGHDGPWVESTGDVLKLWATGDEDYRSEPVTEGRPVRIRRSDMSRMLEQVQFDLLQLLDRIDRWASHHAPAHAVALVQTADHVFDISRPLPWRLRPPTGCPSPATAAATTTCSSRTVPEA